MVENLIFAIKLAKKQIFWLSCSSSELVTLFQMPSRHIVGAKNPFDNPATVFGFKPKIQFFAVFRGIFSPPISRYF